MESKLVKLSADGATAVVTTATITDAVTTLVSQDSAVTGLYGLGQKVALVGIGMGIQNKRRGLPFNPINA